MGISLQQELLRTARVVGEATRDFQIEARLSLPAGNPPLERIQACRARIRDLHVSATTGYLVVEGLTEVELIYQGPVTEPDQLTVQEELMVWSKENGGALAFTQEVPLPAAQPGMMADAEAVVAGANAELLDGHNLRCQVSLVLSVAAAVPEATRVVTDISMVPPDRLGVVKEVLRLENLAGQTELEVPVNTVLILPEVKPDLIRLISRHARVTEVSAEVARGRAIITGRLELNTVYVGRLEEGGQSIEVSEWGGEGRPPIGFEAFADLAAFGAEGSVEPVASLGRLNVEAIGPREVRLDATVLVTVKAVQTGEVPMLTELIPGADEVVDLQWTQVDCLNLAGRAEHEIAFESTLEIPQARPGLERILQIKAVPRELTAQAAEGKCLIDGWMDVALLYQTESVEGAPPTLALIEWSRHQGTSLPVAAVVEMPEANPGLETSLTWRLGRLSIEQIAPRILRLTAAIPSKVKLTEHKVFSAIVEAAVVPVAPVPGRPSMLFYVAQPGDTLWSIARRYETTVEALARINKIADPAAIRTGDKLLIPKSPVAV